MLSRIEPHLGSSNAKLNWLRAGVLGANDGIVSIAGLLFGVAGATNSSGAIITAGVAGIIAAAISMAAGEYVSVSSSRDAEKALLAKERYELEHFPTEELEELAGIYEKKGLTKKTAQIVAQELTKHDAVAAHFDAELRIDPNDLTNPWNAAIASAVAFVLGSSIPFIAIILPSASTRVPIAFSAVVAALFLTGFLSAKVGGANAGRAILRVVIGGILAMVITYAIGRAFGTTFF